MLNYAAFFIGSLIPTLLVSRLLLVILKKWDGGITRIFFVHVITLIVASLVSGMGMADGGAFAPISGAISYFPSVMFWFMVDTIRNYRAPRRETTERIPPTF